LKHLHDQDPREPQTLFKKHFDVGNALELLKIS